MSYGGLFADAPGAVPSRDEGSGEPSLTDDLASGSMAVTLPKSLTFVLGSLGKTVFSFQIMPSNTCLFSFQDSAYLPWHSVQYYRLLRFFTGGQALMLTSAEQPSVSISYMRSRKTGNPQVLSGHYKVSSNRLFVELQDAPRPRPRIDPRKRNQQPEHDSGHKRYLMVYTKLKRLTQNHNNVGLQELEVKGPNKLVWSRYCIETSYLNAPKAVCEFELKPSQFPALNFARVRSYMQMPAHEML
jgi:hypothetical protein